MRRGFLSVSVTVGKGIRPNNGCGIRLFGVLLFSGLGAAVPAQGFIHVDLDAAAGQSVLQGGHIQRLQADILLGSHGNSQAGSFTGENTGGNKPCDFPAAAGGGVHGIGPVPPAIWQVIVAVADADMQQLLRQAAIYLVPQTVIQRQIDADMAQGSQTAQDDAFLQQNDPGAIACGRNRGGYTGYWRAADVLEFTSHGYDGYVFDENNNRIDFKGYRADCINQFALDYLDQYTGEKPFFMTVSQIEPHHQNDHNHYEGPNGSKQRFADFVLPEDLKALGGNAAEEYPDYLGQCASLDENLGKLVEKLKEKGLYENTVILYASDHGSHFKTRNRDAHLNGYDDYKRSCHDGCLHVPLVICGGPFKGGKEVTELVSTESIPKTLLALAGVDVGDKMLGENLLDVVEKKNHNRANEVYAQISESRCGRCIRTADYMYSVYAPGVNGGEAAASDVYADDFLYDMQKDPWQLNNVVADPAYADVKAELRERLLNWIQHAEGTRPTITD